MNVVYKYQPETGFDTPERCRIVELLNDNDSPDLSIAQASVKPGVKTQLHNLTVDERYIIVEGEGEVEINEGSPIFVSQYDVVNIPAGTSQRITNTGECDLVFLCICSPRFQPDSYVNME